MLKVGDRVTHRSNGLGHVVTIKRTEDNRVAMYDGSVWDGADSGQTNCSSLFCELKLAEPASTPERPHPWQVFTPSASVGGVFPHYVLAEAFRKKVTAEKYCKELLAGGRPAIVCCVH